MLYVPVHSTSPRVQPSQETVLLAMPPAFRNLPEKDFHGGRHIPKKVRRRHRGHSRSFGAVGLVGGEAPRDGHGDDLPDAFGNELASMVPTMAIVRKQVAAGGAEPGGEKLRAMKN